MRVLTVCSLVSSVLAFGCDEPAELRPLDCSTGTVAALQGVTPAVPVDFLAIRQDLSDGGAFVFERRGTECGEPSCRAALSSLREVDDGGCAPAGLNPAFCGRHYWVFTRGADAGRLVQRAEFVSFFGSFETPSDAIALAERDGLSVACRWDAGVARVSASFIDVTFFETGCQQPESLVTRRTFRDGGVEVLSKQALGTMGPCQ